MAEAPRHISTQQHHVPEQDALAQRVSSLEQKLAQRDERIAELESLIPDSERVSSLLAGRSAASHEALSRSLSRCSHYVPLLYHIHNYCRTRSRHQQRVALKHWVLHIQTEHCIGSCGKVKRHVLPSPPGMANKGEVTQEMKARQWRDPQQWTLQMKDWYAVLEHFTQLPIYEVSIHCHEAEADLWSCRKYVTGSSTCPCTTSRSMVSSV